VLVPLAAAALALPLLAMRARTGDPAPPAAQRRDKRDIVIASLARLLVQLACATLGLYLLYYFQTLRPGGRGTAAWVGSVLMLSYLIPLPAALLAGRWSDRLGRRRPFQCVAALVGAAGLAGMAGAANAWQGAAAFCLFSAGTAVFLSLNTTFAMQLLPRPDRRGRDLGLVNLANTLPAMIGTLLVWQLATPGDFTAVLVAFAALTAAGGLAILAVRESPVPAG